MCWRPLRSGQARLPVDKGQQRQIRPVLQLIQHIADSSRCHDSRIVTATRASSRSSGPRQPFRAEDLQRSGPPSRPARRSAHSKVPALVSRVPVAWSSCWRPGRYYRRRASGRSTCTTACLVRQPRARQCSARRRYAPTGPCPAATGWRGVQHGAYRAGRDQYAIDGQQTQLRAGSRGGVVHSVPPVMPVARWRAKAKRPPHRTRRFRR